MRQQMYVAGLLSMIAACSPVVQSTALAPTPYPAHPGDHAIRMYSTQRPRCAFEELALVRSAKATGFTSMDKVAEALRGTARRLGGDAVIGVANGTLKQASTDDGATVAVVDATALSGTVIRFRDRGCQE